MQPQKKINNNNPVNFQDNFIEKSAAPSKLVVEILFHNFDVFTLGKSCVVSKEWKKIASENDALVWKKAIYRELAFGNAKWAQCFGYDVVKGERKDEYENLEQTELSSFPVNAIMQKYREFKIKFPEINVKNYLMLVKLPKTLNNQISLNSLGELAKEYFPNNRYGYESIKSSIREKIGDESIDKSCWVMMTKGDKPGIKELKQMGYEVPHAVEAAACIFAQYFGYNVRVFDASGVVNDDGKIFARTKDIVEDEQVIVGGFYPEGLNIEHNYESKHIGDVAILRL